MREKIAEQKAQLEARARELAGKRLELTRQVEEIDKELEQLRGAIFATERLHQEAVKAQGIEGEGENENASAT